jgi:hypothetical protein
MKTIALNLQNFDTAIHLSEPRLLRVAAQLAATFRGNLPRK